MVIGNGCHGPAGDCQYTPAGTSVSPRTSLVIFGGSTTKPIRSWKMTGGRPPRGRVAIASSRAEAHSCRHHRARWLVPLGEVRLSIHLAGIRTKDGSTITSTWYRNSSSGEMTHRPDGFRRNYLDKTMAHIADSGRKVLESRRPDSVDRHDASEISADREAAGAQVAEKVQEDFQRHRLGLMNIVVKDGPRGKA